MTEQSAARLCPRKVCCVWSKQDQLWPKQKWEWWCNGLIVEMTCAPIQFDEYCKSIVMNQICKSRDWPKSLSTVYSCNMLYMTLAYTFHLLWGFNILLEVSVLLLSCHSHIYPWSQPMASDLLRCTFPQCTEGLALTESHLYLDHVSYIVCKYNNIIKYKPFRKRRCYHGTGCPSNLIMSTYSAV